MSHLHERVPNRLDRTLDSVREEDLPSCRLHESAKADARDVR